MFNEPKIQTAIRFFRKAVIKKYLRGGISLTT